MSRVPDSSASLEAVQTLFAEASLQPAPVPAEVVAELEEADEVTAEEQRESWECAGSRDVGEACWCGRCS